MVILASPFQPASTAVIAGRRTPTYAMSAGSPSVVNAAAAHNGAATAPVRSRASPARGGNSVIRIKNVSQNTPIPTARCSGASTTAGSATIGPAIAPSATPTKMIGTTGAIPNGSNAMATDAEYNAASDAHQRSRQPAE